MEQGLIISICDDERENRELLEGYTRRLKEEEGGLLRLRSHASAEELLLEKELPDILLLDVQMGGMDGIRAAQRLRKNGCRSVIILVTNYLQYAVDGYEISAFQFLKKPVAYERFRQVMLRALRLARRRKEASITVKGDGQTVRLVVGEISYLETDTGRTLIHTGERVIKCYSSMAQLEERLREQSFFRCHSAYLINLAWVERFEMTSVWLRDGTELPVSKHRKKAFREAMTAFWGKEFL